MPDRRKALEGIVRILKHGGAFCASAIGRSHLSEMDQLAYRWLPEDQRDDTSEKFGLKTGEAQLRRFFKQVKISNYEDSLEIPDAKNAELFTCRH